MHITVLSDNLPARGAGGRVGPLPVPGSTRGTPSCWTPGPAIFSPGTPPRWGWTWGPWPWGVLSHAHWDHANGMDAFFARNPSAPFYLQASCGEVCFDHSPGLWRYEGPRRGLLARFASRIRYVEGAFSPLPGVTLLPPHHPRPGPKGSGPPGCSAWRGASGSPTISPTSRPWCWTPPAAWFCATAAATPGRTPWVREVQVAFPGRPIRAIVGGFHLYATPDQEVRILARRLRDTGVERVLTGHCTGERGFCPAPGGAGGDGGAVLPPGWWWNCEAGRLTAWHR